MKITITIEDETGPALERYRETKARLTEVEILGRRMDIEERKRRLAATHPSVPPSPRPGPEDPQPAQTAT